MLYILLAFLLPAVSATSSASISDCIEDPSFFNFLSGHIGDGNPKSPFIYLLPCDTMYIAKGVTVKVAPNTFLAFADPKPENAIIVKGNLIIQGSYSSSVTISSSIDTVMLGRTSLRKPWKGIVVDSTGLLVLQNTMVYGAKIPLTLHSNDVNITSSFFYDGHEIAIPGNKNYLLSRDHFIQSFSLPHYLDGLKQPPPDTAVPEPPKKPKQKSSYWLTYSSIAIIFTGGLAHFIYNYNDKKNRISADQALLKEMPSFPEQE